MTLGWVNLIFNANHNAYKYRNNYKFQGIMQMEICIILVCGNIFWYLKFLNGLLAYINYN